MLLGSIKSLVNSENLFHCKSFNIPLDDLYKEGLQREQFLPEIKLVKKHIGIFHLDFSKDC